MIFLKRRRLVVWLLKAYLKKWRRTIFLSFVLGLAVFFILKFGVNYFIPLIPFTQQQSVGVVGSYSVDNPPSFLLAKISRGLTYISSDQTPKPDIAKSWDIKDNGKTYIFYLKNNIYFSDGTKLTSNEIKYNFLNVSVERPDKYTIIFRLKNVYSPFLTTVSRPIFKPGFVGIGEYRVQSINVNGNFIQSINIVSVKGETKEISYQFYPTEESLKTAFVLGDLSKIIGVRNISYQNKNLNSFTNATVTESIDYSKLITIFYNTQDKDLSDKKLREALSYSIPDSFSHGKRNYGPFVPNSWVGQDGLASYSQDLEHSKLLLGQIQGSSKSASLTLEIKTLAQFVPLASQIKSIWEHLGIKTNVNIVSTYPSDFQVFLGEFNVPKDPDQYTLWHSSQMNNITNYKNLRIDKLLEDGRQTLDLSEREKIYSDFQKYLLDDPPATFLYFPFVYEVTRK